MLAGADGVVLPELKFRPSLSELTYAVSFAPGQRVLPELKFRPSLSAAHVPPGRGTQRPCCRN